MQNQSDREPGVFVHDGQKERIPGQRHDLNKCTLQGLLPVRPAGGPTAVTCDPIATIVECAWEAFRHADAHDPAVLVRPSAPIAWFGDLEQCSMWTT